MGLSQLTKGVGHLGMLVLAFAATESGLGA
jgi:hypothetical protein